MKLTEARKRLPVVDVLPPSRSRRYLPEEAAGVAVPRPSLAVWEITLACDRRCLHCGPRAGEARPDELSTEEALDVVDQLAELGVGEVVLIARAIREKGMSCTLTTGGLGLTKTRERAPARPPP